MQSDEIEGADRRCETEPGTERMRVQDSHVASAQATAAIPKAGDDERPPVAPKPTAAHQKRRDYVMARSVEKRPTRTRSEPVGVRHRDRAAPGPAVLDMNAAASQHVTPFIEATDVGASAVAGSSRPRGGEPGASSSRPRGGEPGRSRSPPLPILLLRAEERRRAAAANLVAGCDSIGVFEPSFEPTLQPINVTRRMELVQSTLYTRPSRALAAVPVD